MEFHQVQKIVIVGGGTAGWMAAASLSKHFRRTAIKISLIESSQIGTIGVGEATIPTLRRFYGELGLQDFEVMKATQATCKLGIEFRDWHKPGSSFMHPFGLFGQKANNIDFHHYWLKLRQLGDTSDLADYSLGVSLAKGHKFVEPSPNPPSELSVFDWALHFDASLFAQLMRSYAEAKGIERIDAKIADVTLDPDSGFIRSVSLDSGATIEGDLFIDCSGFRGLLIKEALGVGYEDWSQWLVCDRAVAVQSVRTGDPAPYTVTQAHQAGWQWRIPLQHRQGNGHVYCSHHISDDEATATLVRNIDGELLHDPRKFSFTPGRRTKAWHKNCVALGLASGFLEPLESTSIGLVETGIEKIRMAFPDPYFHQSRVDTFNELTAMEYERVRDFLILHYKLNGRDGKMWEYCRNMEIPEELADKVEKFRSTGELIRYPTEIFGPPSWLAIYNGFNVLPETYDRGVDKVNSEYLKRAFAEMRKSVARAVDSVSTHAEFIAEYCAAPQP